MNTRKRLASLRSVSVALLASFFIAACGGGSSSTPDPAETPPTTGMVGLWFTDLPTQDFESIVLAVNSATLIGEDESHHVLFEGMRTIDLLNLTNYTEPVIFGEVQVGTYKKIRLMIDSIKLYPDVDDPDNFVLAKVPANGKVDLLQADGFDVLPGRTVMVELDIDANKAFKLTNAGNSGKINFRPVVKVNVYYEDGVPPKLVRLEGAVSGEPDGSMGTFVLCNFDAPDFCVDVSTDSTTTSFFDDQGLGTDFMGLSDGSMVVVIGEYSSDPILLNAFVVEIGGNAEQVSGDVVGEPDGSRFLVLTFADESVVVELQPGTKFYNAVGPIDPAALVLGAAVEVEGVRPTTGLEGDPDFRAALVFLEAPDADLLSGTIVTLTPAGEGTLASMQLQPEDAAAPEACVNIASDARILLVSADNGEVTEGDFDSLVVAQVVDVFGGTPDGESCFLAEEVIVDLDLSP